jgi:hypothetical protein
MVPGKGGPLVIHATKTCKNRIPLVWSSRRQWDEALWPARLCDAMTSLSTSQQSGMDARLQRHLSPPIDPSKLTEEDLDDLGRRMAINITNMKDAIDDEQVLRRQTENDLMIKQLSEEKHVPIIGKAYSPVHEDREWYYHGPTWTGNIISVLTSCTKIALTSDQLCQ